MSRLCGVRDGGHSQALGEEVSVAGAELVKGKGGWLEKYVGLRSCRVLWGFCL